jgi:hypothetical protein
MKTITIKGKKVQCRALNPGEHRFPGDFTADGIPFDRGMHASYQALHNAQLQFYRPIPKPRTAKGKKREPEINSRKCWIHRSVRREARGAFDLLEATVKAERKVLVTLRNYIERQGKKQDEAVELLRKVQPFFGPRNCQVSTLGKEITDYLASGENLKEVNANATDGREVPVCESRKFDPAAGVCPECGGMKGIDPHWVCPVCKGSGKGGKA